MILKNQVKMTRVKSNMQQKVLARKVGISRQTMSLIEKGDYNPSLKLCLGIARALHTNLDLLFGDEINGR